MIWYYSVIVNKVESFYVAYSPDHEISCQGNTIADAMKNLQAALEVYIKIFGPGNIAGNQDSVISAVPVQVPEDLVPTENPK